MKSLFFLLIFAFVSQIGIAQDWPNLAKFRDANEKLGAPAAGERRIVFMGNSITEGWIKADPDFFEKYRLINRGISGQTTPQMVLRFRQDVIDLKPKAVFILAGINDIAGNTGPSTLKMIEDNYQNMAVLARSAGAKVFLCSVLPSNLIAWRDNMNPSEEVMELNTWMKSFAAKFKCEYIDYYTPLADAENGLPEKYSKDGVHPTLEGYKVMERVIVPHIKKIRSAGTSRH